eukprot:6032801-Pyramimonas_sp.AAC.1
MPRPPIDRLARTTPQGVHSLVARQFCFVGQPFEGLAAPATAQHWGSEGRLCAPVRAGGICGVGFP